VNTLTKPNDDNAVPDAVLERFESLTMLKRHNAIDEPEQQQLDDLITQHPELKPLLVLDEYWVMLADAQALPQVYAALQPDARAAREKKFMEKIQTLRLAEAAAYQASLDAQPQVPVNAPVPRSKPGQINADHWIRKIKEALGINGGWQLVPAFAMGALAGVVAFKVLPIATNEPVTRSIVTVQNNADIRIAVSDAVSMIAVQRTLLSLKAQIVAGPDSMGFITLRVARTDAAAALAVLKSQQWIVSASLLP
jgi:hypothetical protein